MSIFTGGEFTIAAGYIADITQTTQGHSIFLPAMITVYTVSLWYHR